MRLAPVLLALLTSQAFAQTATPVQAPDQQQTTEGWTNTASLGANLSFTSSQDVVGQQNGTTETYGLNLKGDFDYKQDRNEWRNGVGYIGSTTRTPKLPRFVKTSDELKYTTIFNHQFIDSKLGPYVSGEASAPVMKGEDVRTGPTPYRISRAGQPDQVVSTSTLRLSDPFKPLTTKEGAGILYKAVEEPSTKLEFRLGVAGLQIAADGQFAVQGSNDSTGEVNVKELRSVNQWGVEAAAALKGKIDEKSNYEAGLSALTPFYTNKADEDHRSSWELTNVEGNAKLTTNVVSWASFSYEYRLKIQPQLIERAQQLHLIVFNVTYNLL